MARGELVTDYCVLDDSCYVDLQATVLTAIADGWQPLGGLAVCEQERVSEIPFSTAKYHDRKFLQVMVKYEE